LANHSKILLSSGTYRCSCLCLPCCKWFKFIIVQ
jgi:hypothetical protein